MDPSVEMLDMIKMLDIIKQIYRETEIKTGAL